MTAPGTDGTNGTRGASPTGDFGEGVAERLRQAAGPGGFLRFDRFMEIALYEAGVGFYTRPFASFGPGGAFYTAPRLTPLFGRALAAWVAGEHHRLGAPRRFRLVELGAGDGRLAVDLLRALRKLIPDPAPIDYVLVERSGPLRDRALEALADVAEEGRVEVRVSDDVGSDGPFTGVVLAHEFLDALPFRRLVRRGEAWRELGVRPEGDRFVWAEGEPVGPTASGARPSAEEGQRIEETACAEAAVREVADHLVEGSLLVIDYGMNEDELVRAHPDGTLAAVRDHRALADPLDRPGSADLSAFLNWTRLRSAAGHAGLRERSVRPLREALVAWGIERLLNAAEREAPDEEARVRLRLSVKSLLLGFERFAALEWTAGPERDPPTAPSEGADAGAPGPVRAGRGSRRARRSARPRGGGPTPPAG